MNEHSTETANSTQLPELKHISDEEFWNLAQRIAHTTPSIPASSEFLHCQCGQVSCLLPLSALSELVLPTHQFTLLPDMPSWMLGLIAWHGEILAVADLEAYLLDRTITHTSTGGMLLIVHEKNILFSFFVSAIGSTITVEKEEIHPPQPTSPWFSPSRIGAIQGVYKDSLILNIPFILTDVL